MSAMSIKSILLATIVSVTAQGASLKAIANRNGIENLDISVSTGVSNEESVLDKSTTFSTALKIDTNIILAQDINLNALVGMKFETGNSTSAFDQRRNTAKSQLVYDHAFVSYERFDVLKFHVGALNNKNLESSSRFTNYGTPFLGARESINVGNEKHTLTVNLTQAMPYNDQLSEKIGSAQEGTPKFYSEIATLKNTFSNINLNLQAGHYAFEDLSSSVAYNDKFFGNTVTGLNELDSAFAYNFKGWTYAADLTINFKNGLKVSPSYEVVTNDEAVAGSNEGSSISLAAQTEIAGNIIWASITSFENESDTAPAFYNSSNYKNNFKGTVISAKMTNNDGLQTSIDYTNRKVINTSIFLANEKVIKISLRKAYDIF